MRRDPPFLTEAQLSFTLAMLVTCGLIFAAALFAQAWARAHPAPEKPEPKICAVMPIRGGGGMVTFCEPDRAHGVRGAGRP